MTRFIALGFRYKRKFQRFFLMPVVKLFNKVSLSRLYSTFTWLLKRCMSKLLSCNSNAIRSLTRRSLSSLAVLICVFVRSSFLTYPHIFPLSIFLLAPKASNRLSIGVKIFLMFYKGMLMRVYLLVYIKERLKEPMLTLPIYL